MNDKNIINSTLAQEKLQLLQEELRRLGSVLVAFSGGVDSTFLLQVAHLTLGEKALAITARSGVVPQRDLREAEAFCAKYGIRHLYFDFDELITELNYDVFGNYVLSHERETVDPDMLKRANIVLGDCYKEALKKKFQIRL